MSRRRGYADDFGDMRGGGIGGEVGLFPDTLEPEIGTRVAVRVATAGRTCILLTDDGSALEVEDAHIFHAYMAEDRPHHFTLQDRHQYTLAKVTLVPKVAVPEIKLLVPERVTWDSPNFRVDLQMTEVQDIEAKWRNGSDWIRLNYVANALFVPILQRPGQIELEMVFKSRHAAFSERGRVEINKVVQVTHPEPAVRWTGENRIFQRHEPVSCDLVCSWVTDVVIEGDGIIKKGYSPLDNHQVRCSMPLSTAEIGQRHMTVHVLDLEGKSHAFNFIYEVRARRCSLETWQASDGGLGFAISGGVGAWIVVPERGITVDIQYSSGVLSHEFLTCVECIFVVVDDSGGRHEHRVVLDRAPHLRKPGSAAPPNSQEDPQDGPEGDAQ